MRRALSLAAVLLICITLAMPVFAADAVYVPSITAKPAPELNQPAQDGTGVPMLQVENEDEEIVHVSPVENLIITSVAEVMAEQEVRISEEASELLKEVFEILDTKGAETFEEIPELTQAIKEANVKVEDLVVMDLFDVTIINEELEKHLNVDGHTIELVFARDIPADQKVFVMVFKEDKWQLIESVVNNGDGSITCVFEHFCPVAILTAPVSAAEEAEPAAQEQSAGFPWWIIPVAVAVVIIVPVAKRKGSKEKA